LSKRSSGRSAGAGIARTGLSQQGVIGFDRNDLPKRGKPSLGDAQDLNRYRYWA
jgi:hypothetical protein